MTGRRRRAVLGLGSNLGDRAFHLRAAVAALGEEVTAVSAVYETEPVGGPEQGAYLNLVAVLATERTPHELLDVARRLEAAAERVRAERWGPRTLDVDVLWVDGEAVDDPDLTVPHPRMFERDFVLAPLAEVAGDLLPADWDGPGAGVVALGPLVGELPDAGPDATVSAERRRRVIEAALDLHPDLYLDQLAAAFATVGLGRVDEDLLVADLEAMGFAVDEEDEEGAGAADTTDTAEAADAATDQPGADLPAGAAPDEDEGAAEAAPSAPSSATDAGPDGPDAAGRPDAPGAGTGPGTDEDDETARLIASLLARPVTDAFADDLRSSAPRRPARRSRFGIDRTVVIAAAVALLVVVVAFALAAIGGDDDEPTGREGVATSGDSTPNLGEGSLPADGEDDETTETAPLGPGADPELAAGGNASSSFDDDGDTLPDLGDLEWEVDRGGFTVVDQRVVAVPAEDGSGALATVDVGTRDFRFELALPEANDGTGVAFGLRDDGSYLLWAPAPGYPTVGLFLVRDGTAEFLLNGGVRPTEPGVRLGIHVAGDQVELLAGGAVLATYTDDSGSTRVGMGIDPSLPFGVLDDVVWGAGGTS